MDVKYLELNKQYYYYHQNHYFLVVLNSIKTKLRDKKRELVYTNDIHFYDWQFKIKKIYAGTPLNAIFTLTRYNVEHYIFLDPEVISTLWNL